MKTAATAAMAPGSSATFQMAAIRSSASVRSPPSREDSAKPSPAERLLRSTH